MHSNGNGSFSVDEWLVEPELNRISYREEIHYLRPQVMDLLVYLARRNGQVISTEELLTDLWTGKIVSHGTVYNCIAELRHALTNGHDSGGEIENIPKKGYRLVAQVKDASSGAMGTADVRADIERTPGPLNRFQLACLSAGTLILATVMFAFFGMRTAPLLMTGASQLSASQILFPPVPSSHPLVTDGSRIYFNDWGSGRLGLRQMLVGGGDAIRMDSPFADAEVLINPQTITPDGADLVATAFLPGKKEMPSLWLWPLLEGSPRRIGGAVAAVFSPDGERIAYSNTSGELLIDSLGMQNPEILASLPGRIFWPAFSPDGQRMRFSLRRFGGLPNTIWEISLAGGEARQLFPDWSSRSHCCGSWTPDGEDYIFQVIDDGRSQIWNSSESTGLFGSGRQDPYPLTRGPIDFRRPTIAPEGDRVFAAGWQLRGEIVRYDSVTQKFVAIPELEAVSAEWLAYLGDQLAYISYPDATLWVSNSDGTKPRQLSFSPLKAHNPVWSPDGSTIAFEGRKPGEQRRIFTVSLDTGQIVAATHGDGFQMSPTWSPDGGMIAFTEQGKENIQLLTFANEKVTELAGTKNMNGPKWSADGKFIATRGKAGLELYDMKSGSREVIFEQFPVEGHYWDRNSQHVFFYEPFWRANARSIHKANIHSKEVERVAEVGNVRSTWGIDGMWIGPGPDDEPILLRDLSIHHIYALDITRE